MYCHKLRVDKETGKKKFAVIQAEDELAAIGMVIGANWNGLGHFTATSGPGISLMSEFLGLAYFAEVPCCFSKYSKRRSLNGNANPNSTVRYNGLRVCQSW